MARIGTVGRAEAAQFRTVRAEAASDAIPAGRALVAIDDGQRTRRGLQPRTGRPDSGFVAQLLACTDPALRPSRLERTRAAADLYAAAARLAS
jgi:hypothetical protein